MNRPRPNNQVGVGFILYDGEIYFAPTTTEIAVDREEHDFYDARVCAPSTYIVNQSYNWRCKCGHTSRMRRKVDDTYVRHILKDEYALALVQLAEPPCEHPIRIGVGKLA